MADLRAALNGLGRSKHRTYLLTFAAGAFSDFITHTELDKLQALVDFVNLMTYDFRVAEADPVSGHHANLFPSAADAEQRSVDRAVKEFLRRRRAAGEARGGGAVLRTRVGGGGGGPQRPLSARQANRAPNGPQLRTPCRLCRPRRVRTFLGRRIARRRTCGTPAAESSSPTKTRNRSAERAATSSSTASRGLCSGSTTRTRQGRCSMRSTRRSASGLFSLM